MPGQHEKMTIEYLLNADQKDRKDREDPEEPPAGAKRPRSEPQHTPPESKKQRCSSLVDLLEAAKELDDVDAALEEKRKAHEEITKAAREKTTARLERLFAVHAAAVRESVSDPKMQTPVGVHDLVQICEEDLMRYMSGDPGLNMLTATINIRLDRAQKRTDNVRITRRMLNHFKDQYDARVAAGKPVSAAWYEMIGLDEALLTDFLNGHRQVEAYTIWKALKDLQERTRTSSAPPPK